MQPAICGHGTNPSIFRWFFPISMPSSWDVPAMDDTKWHVKSRWMMQLGQNIAMKIINDIPLESQWNSESHWINPIWIILVISKKNRRNIHSKEAIWTIHKNNQVRILHRLCFSQINPNQIPGDQWQEAIELFIASQVARTAGGLDVNCVKKSLRISMKNQCKIS